MYLSVHTRIIDLISMVKESTLLVLRVCQYPLVLLCYYLADFITITKVKELLLLIGLL